MKDFCIYFEASVVIKAEDDEKACEQFWNFVHNGGLPNVDIDEIDDVEELEESEEK